MSDRREAVAAALVAALGKYGSIHDAGYGFTTLTLYHDDMPHIARRLLDAMDAEPTIDDTNAAIGLPQGISLDPWDDDAEPTEAEIDRLAEASWYAVDGDISSVAWSAVRHALKGEKERRRVRAIIAARKAGRE